MLAAFSLLALMALGAVGYLVWQRAADDTIASEPGASVDAAPADGSGEVTGDETAVEDGATGQDPAEDPAGEPPVSLAAPTPPYMTATLVGKDFTLSGTLPSQELVDGIVQAVTPVYAPFIESTLQVDPSLPQEPWLAAAPYAAAMAQTMTEGSVTLSEGRLIIEGRTGAAEDVDLLEQRLTTATGLPVERGNIEVTNLREAIYVLAGSDGQIALSGALPNDEVRAGLVEAAAGIYGAANVLDASTVDPGVDTALWMYNPQALIATLAQFPDYEIRLNGGALEASLSGGNIYPPNSSEISPEFAQVLTFGAVVLARDPAMSIAIEGHTDSDGDDAFNLALSQERADAVAAYFVAFGIEPERVSAVGKGESEPAASNDTPEGRSRNRRVEFVLSDT